MEDQEFNSTNGEGQYEEDQQEHQEQQEMQADTEQQSESASQGGAGGEPEEDEESRKIFVGGLSWETTVKDLKDYFSKFGDVQDATLKTDLQTGRSRGFGFVTFTSSSGVTKVTELGQHTLHGKTIDPKKAKARPGREPIKKVFVGGLDPEVPETEIREHFGKYGNIEEIELPFDKVKNQRRFFCFISFESEKVVDACCAPGEKHVLGGKDVDVKKATPKREDGGFGGGGFGGGFGGGRGGGRGRGGGGFGGSYGGGGYSEGGRGRGRGGSRGGSGGYGGGSYGGGWGNQGGGGYNDYYSQGSYGSGGGGYGGSGYDYNQGGSGNYGGYDYNQYGQGGYGGGSGYGARR